MVQRVSQELQGEWILVTALERLDQADEEAGQGGLKVQVWGRAC